MTDQAKNFGIGWHREFPVLRIGISENASDLLAGDGAEFDGLKRNDGPSYQSERVDVNRSFRSFSAARSHF